MRNSIISTQCHIRLLAKTTLNEKFESFFVKCSSQCSISFRTPKTLSKLTNVLKPHRENTECPRQGKAIRVKGEETWLKITEGGLALGWHSSPEHLKNEHNIHILQLTSCLTNGTRVLIGYSSLKFVCIIVLQFTPPAIANQILFLTFPSLGIDNGVQS